MFGADVFHYDAINDLFPEAYEAAVAESGIEPVDRPEVDIVSASTEDGVVLKAVVTVKPEMKVGEYKGLKATKKVNTVEDAAVEAEIERMRERNARIITREGKAQDGDVTDIDFVGFVDGVAAGAATRRDIAHDRFPRSSRFDRGGLRDRLTSCRYGAG